MLLTIAREYLVARQANQEFTRPFHVSAEDWALTDVDGYVYKLKTQIMHTISGIATIYEIVKDDDTNELLFIIKQIKDDETLVDVDLEVDLNKIQHETLNPSEYQHLKGIRQKIQKLKQQNKRVPKVKVVSHREAESPETQNKQIGENEISYIKRLEQLSNGIKYITSYVKQTAPNNEILPKILNQNRDLIDKKLFQKSNEDQSIH